MCEFDLLLCMSLLTPYKRHIISSAGDHFKLAMFCILNYVSASLSVCMQACFLLKSPNTCADIVKATFGLSTSVQQKNLQQVRMLLTHKQYAVYYFILCSVSSLFGPLRLPLTASLLWRGEVVNFAFLKMTLDLAETFVFF